MVWIVLQLPFVPLWFSCFNLCVKFHSVPVTVNSLAWIFRFCPLCWWCWGSIPGPRACWDHALPLRHPPCTCFLGANAKVLQWIFLLPIFLSTLNTESGSESELHTNTQLHQLVTDWSPNRLYQIKLPQELHKCCLTFSPTRDNRRTLRGPAIKYEFKLHFDFVYNT